MGNEFGSFDNGERIRPKETESIVEFYNRLRGDEIKDNTKDRFTTAYNNLVRYTNRGDEDDDTPESPVNFTESDVRDWCRWMLKQNGQKPSGANEYLTRVAQMMGDLAQADYIGGNESPFRSVSKNNPFDYEEGAVWIEVEYERLINGILDINHPRIFAEVATLAKTGLRLGELVNQDEATVNLNHEISTTLADPIQRIADKPNTIYVNSTINKGEEHRGEVRSASNKKSSHRIIPIDGELCEILAWYLSLRPRSHLESRPLFTTVGANERIGPSAVEKNVREFAKENGWHGVSGITPHFFRHWYTTNIRSNLSMVDNNKYPGTPGRIVKGLRGDSDDDTIETYSHDWSKGLEADTQSTDDLIRKCIPKFFE